MMQLKGILQPKERCSLKGFCSLKAALQVEGCQEKYEECGIQSANRQLKERCSLKGFCSLKAALQVESSTPK
jgi:hypothetical protein